jgi:flagellar biosynthesis/type III secretory pathway chaperone
MDQEARRRLEDVLDREVEAARHLSTTLAAERDALTGDAAAAVEQIAAEKIDALGTLERLEHERRALCAATGLNVPDNRPQDNDGAMATAVAERWRVLMELMARCRTANDINGYIIRVRQNQIRQLMDIVRGTSPVTYGPQGKSLGSAQRALARA